MGPCAFCRQVIDADPVSCPRCHATYHADCWMTNVYRCAIYGCERAPVPAPPPPPRRLPELPARENPVNMGWMLFGIIVLVNLGRLMVPLPSRPSPGFERYVPPAWPGQEADSLVREAELILRPISPWNADPDVRAKWRDDLDLAISLLVRAKGLYPPGYDRITDDHIHRVTLRISDAKMLRERLGD